MTGFSAIAVSVFVALFYGFMMVNLLIIHISENEQEDQEGIAP